MMTEDSYAIKQNTFGVPEIKARKIKQATFKQDYLSKTHLSKTDIKARHIKARLFLYINKYQKIVCTYLDSHS